MNASSAMNSNIYSNRHDPFDKALSLHFLALSPGEARIHCMRMRAIKIYNQWVVSPEYAKRRSTLAIYTYHQYCNSRTRLRSRPKAVTFSAEL